MSSKDVSFQIEDTVFQYRCGCIIEKHGKVLVMREELDGDYDYFVGGRVQIGEDSFTALCRELDEELGIKKPQLELKAVVENFFNLNHQPYQELGLYYVLHDEKELQDTHFERLDSDGKNHFYSWISIENLKQHIIYPKVIKDNIEQIIDTNHVIYFKQFDENYMRNGKIKSYSNEEAISMFKEKNL